MYLLDTNICIFIKNKKFPQVLEKLHTAIQNEIYISSISVAEMEYGVFNSDDIERNSLSLIEFLAPFNIINFDDNDAVEFGKLRATLKKNGRIIGPYDMLIAAQALSKDLILVTNNTKEFNRIDGIKLEDWK
jgi:tRNA(fMet)-specific endonuclease VapC